MDGDTTRYIPESSDIHSNGPQQDESSDQNKESIEEDPTETKTELLIVRYDVEASNEDNNDDNDEDDCGDDGEEGDKDILDINRVEEIEVCPPDESDAPPPPPPPVPEVRPSWKKCLLTTSLFSLWLSFILYAYLYLSTTCSQVTLWCPDPTVSFTARACCSSLWLSLGAPVGLGNECTFDMSEMESGCPMYDCYTNQTDGTLNVNGCSYVPNTLFNVGACNIHDLCYITPGATKKDCDDTFVDNIIRIYCDNVNVVERLSCTGRAQVAGAVVSAINSFYDDSEEIRSGCSRTLGYGSTVAIIMTIVITVSIPIICRIRCKPKPTDTEGRGTKDVILEEKIEEIKEDAISTGEDELKSDSDKEDSDDDTEDELTRLLSNSEEKQKCDDPVNPEDLAPSQLVEDEGQDVEQSTMESTEHNDNQL